MTQEYPRNRLTGELEKICVNIAHHRQEVNERLGRIDIHCASGVWSHLRGVRAECASAMQFNRFWVPVYEADEIEKVETEPDLEGLEIRSTPHRFGHLLMHDNDLERKSEIPFVLVRVIGPYFVYPGWLIGKDGIRDEYWNTKEMAKSPCYMIPNEYPPLREAEELLEVLPSSDFGGWEATLENLRREYGA